MYSKIIDGKVLDFKYKKNHYGYDFSIGDIYIGQVSNISNRWSAVYCNRMSGNPVTLGHVDGFSTRLDACEFLLKVFDIDRGWDRDTQSYI